MPVLFTLALDESGVTAWYNSGEIYLMKIDNNTSSGLKGQMETEIRQYLTETVDVGGQAYSQHKLVQRISLFENKVYPGGKFDKQGNYKGWYDIITPRINGEIKNIDWDTKDLVVHPDPESALYEVPCIITNLKLREYLRTTGQAEEINSTVEEGSGWGNFVLKKVKKTYERADLKNFYVINQTAECLDESPVIERHQFCASDLWGKVGAWENVKEVIEGSGGMKEYKETVGGQAKSTTIPYFEIFERNGEVSVKDLKEAHGEKPSGGDENKYVFAKIIASGKNSETTGVTIDFLLYAEEMKGKSNKDIYKEFHRGRYKGKWFREGLYELLMDCQVRANQIGNQLTRGLEYASTLLLTDDNKLIVQNIMTDVKNGDIVRSKNLRQVDLKMHAADQLLLDWNRNLQLANDIANNSEVVQGEALPSGTTLGAYNMLNTNANKLFVFIREKLAIPFSEMFNEQVVPNLIKDITANDVLALTGDSDMLERLRQLVAQDWYLANLVAIGPHSPEMGQMLKQQKIEELNKRPQLLMQGIKTLFDGFVPRAVVDISGEALNIAAELTNLANFIALEVDPMRRTALVEMAMKKQGIDVGRLPKTPPMPQPTPSPIQPQREKLAPMK